MYKTIIVVLRAYGLSGINSKPWRANEMSLTSGEPNSQIVLSLFLTNYKQLLKKTTFVFLQQADFLNGVISSLVKEYR